MQRPRHIPVIWWCISGLLLSTTSDVWGQPSETSGPTAAAIQEGSEEPGAGLTVDVQGELRYSRDNFTDIKRPYHNIDGWVNGRLSLWFRSDRSLGAYVSLLAVGSSAEEFWWQRYAQAVVGLQWYPFMLLEKSSMSNVRLYAAAAGRLLFAVPEHIERDASRNWDIHVGADYYFDSLFTQDPVAVALWADIGFRATNFSLGDYRSLISHGNFRAGPKLPLGPLGFCFFNGVMDYGAAFRHKNRWWDNFLRLGYGARWYLLAGLEKHGIKRLRRIYLYADWLHQLSWPGSDGADALGIRNTDIRVGVAFSTDGFYDTRRSIP